MIIQNIDQIPETRAQGNFFSYLTPTVITLLVINLLLKSLFGGSGNGCNLPPTVLASLGENFPYSSAELVGSNPLNLTYWILTSGIGLLKLFGSSLVKITSMNGLLPLLSIGVLTKIAVRKKS